MTKEAKRLIKSNNISMQAAKKTIEFNTHLLKKVERNKARAELRGDKI